MSNGIFAPLLAFLVVSTPNAYAQDAREAEIMVVDQACRERKLIECVNTKPLAAPSAGCPNGWEAYIDGLDGGPLCRLVKIESSGSPQIGYLDTRLPMERIGQCAVLVDYFPSAMGENCLKPMVGERFYDAFRSEMTRVFKLICSISKEADCEVLDRLPDAPK